MRRLIYFATPFLTFHYAVALYVNSSFLDLFLPTSLLGLIYALASAITILLLAQMPRWIRRWGLVRLILVIGLLKLPLAALLVFPDGPTLLIFAFIFSEALTLLLSFGLDLALERYSTDAKTGVIRGTYLTLINGVWLAGPLIAGLVLGENNFRLIFLISGLALVPFLVLASRLPEPKFHHRRSLSALETLKRLWQNTSGKARNVKYILLVDFLLNFFYATMVVYTPLYLHNEIGLPWPTVGVIIAIALLPFVLLELPLGRLADRFLGEKEILIAGLVITGLATFFIPFIKSELWWVWALALLATRVGASMIEIMKETYLFKKINYEDTTLLALSRNLYPLAYLVAPLAGSILLFFAPLQYLFIFVGALVLLGTYPALALRDTK